MAKFWEQKAFRDALPYAAGALAIAGTLGAVGANQGWFGGGSSTPSAGGGGGSWLDSMFTQTSGPGDASFGGEGMGGISKAALQNVPGPQAGGIGQAATQAASGAARTGLGRAASNIGLGGIGDFIAENPAVLLAGGLAAAQAFSGGDDAKPNAVQSVQDQIAAQNMAADNQIARWNAIPFTPMEQQARYATPGGRRPGQQRARGGERRYFAEGGALGEEMPVREENGALRGPGDGMSDDIPAIARAADGSERPVDVADGEYVIAADVVSGLGNGSTAAGIRLLDELQAKVRAKRTGGRQPPAINAAAMLPA